jgi:hypothetical protein
MRPDCPLSKPSSQTGLLRSAIQPVTTLLTLSKLAARCMGNRPLKASLVSGGGWG